MKKRFILLLLAIAVCVNGLKAQPQSWSPSGTTSLYYNLGNVGIGTSSPAVALTFPSGSTGIGWSYSSTSNSVYHSITKPNTTPSPLTFKVTYSGWPSDAPLYEFQGQGGHVVMEMLNNGNVTFGGKVGIGQVTIPNTLLHLNTWNSGSALTFQASNQTGRTYAMGINSNGSLFVKDDSDNERITITQVGKIGFGTTAPLTLLHLDTKVASNALTFQASQLTTRTYAIGINSYGSFFINDDSHDRITITQNGNVGIGTAYPGTYMLAVDGVIGAREVKVTTEQPWADFVFKPTYKLRTLGEVEQFIKVNNHLPEIPTEKEVKENGVSLGEMNAKLLQKVEELTLYLIEQNKKIESLEVQVKELRTENSKINNQL